jgi:Mg-chelatase subunit ChlD
MRHLLRSLVCLLGLVPGLQAAAAAGESFQVRITQIDSSAFPKVRIFVSVTDPAGRPISSAHRVRLAVLDAGRELVSQPLSEGWRGSAVLVVDRSGSMKKKIAAARASAKAYVESAPANYEMAVVSFSSATELVQGFTADRALLSARIDEVAVGGRTALQDAVGAALDLLRERGGRKAILLLTDGIENASSTYRGAAGLAALLRRSGEEEVSLSIIGLGGDVNEAYLERLATSGGRYLFAPEASQLRSAFVGEVERLKTEHVLEIVSPSRRADGLREHLDVRLAVDDVPTLGKAEFVAPGVLPHLRGRHTPYVVAVAVLLVLPGLGAALRTLLRVQRFRRRYLQRLGEKSPCLGRREVNSGDKVAPGDLVVLCPRSGTPHFPRSWRLNRCRCMREPACSGAFCYQQVLPAGFRRLLDKLSGSRTGEAGRTWLCHCQGDRQGY